MAGDEYSTGGGGKLKLKGSKVADGRVEKKKKKKGLKKKAEAEAAAAEVGDEKKKSTEVDEDQHQDDERELRNKSRSPDERDERDFGPKTETERKYEEVRRKRLRERLEREGVKTHKERVEDLNKYLSRLSEHHDMPKIGPG